MQTKGILHGRSSVRYSTPGYSSQMVFYREFKKAVYRVLHKVLYKLYSVTFI